MEHLLHLAPDAARGLAPDPRIQPYLSRNSAQTNAFSKETSAADQVEPNRELSREL